MRSPYRYGSKRSIIWNTLLANHGDERTSRNSLLLAVQEGRMIFSRNVNGRRVPLEKNAQYAALHRTFDAVLRQYRSAEEGTPTPPVPESVPDYVEPSSDDGPEIPTEEPTPAPIPTVPSFLERVRKARKYCEERAMAGQMLDSISMRPALYARDALKQGISEDALLYAMTMHWPKDARDAVNIPTVDQAQESEEIEGKHNLLGLALKLASARVPILLTGPAGVGKSRIAKDLANHLGVRYGEVPLTAGATPSWLLGRQTLKDFQTVPFTEIYQNGGVFCFEEIDAADPNMLLVVNNALANGVFFNPANGEEIKRHEDFIPVATANTFGLGATRDFTARERLDAATLDRWRMGRIYVPLDEELETRIFNGEV